MVVDIAPCGDEFESFTDVADLKETQAVTEGDSVMFVKGGGDTTQRTVLSREMES